MHADSFSHRKATARLHILNPDGTLSFTGFKGSYRLETAKRQESFTLERDTEASVRLA